MYLSPSSAPGSASDAAPERRHIRADAVPEPAEAATGAVSGSEIFPGNDGQSHEVAFDGHSFMVDGERLNVWSGEFHYWRLPSPEHWRDLFQKVRANGFNAVSLYFFWGYHQSELGGEFDFSGVKDIDRLLTMAADEGLYVIARPGPYVNAEISMGGLPAYLTNTPDDGGNPGLRTNANLGPSLDWLEAFDEIAVRHQVTDGGGSILLYQVENEMLDENPKRVEFMAELTEQVRADGITVPIFHNDYGMGGRYNPAEPGPARDMGLDFYAYDNYPMGFNCSAGRNRLSDFEAALRSHTTEGPNFITEAQGGAFTPWGADFTFDRCYDFTDPNFVRQYGVNNIANGVTAFNYYMAFGGTNWGWTGSPSSGFTSYDYGAAITEDRQLTEKFTAQRELGYLLDTVPQLASMEPGPSQSVELDSGAPVNGYSRRATEDLDTSVTGLGTTFLGFRLNDSNNTTTTTFTTSLDLNEATTGEDRPEGLVNDSDERIHYTGTWNHDANKNWTAGSIGSDESYGMAGDARASLTFTGSGIELISSKSNNHGKADVLIDGEKVGETNTCIASEEYTSEYQVTSFVSDELDPRVEHTIEIVSRGEVGCPDGNIEPGVNISIDAFKITPARYSVDDSQDGVLDYTGEWTHAEDSAGDYLETLATTAAAGAAVEYTFTGTGIEIIAPQGEDYGVARVLLDGEPHGTFSTYNTAQNAGRQVVAYEIAGLTAGEHTVTVEATGEAGAGGGTAVAIDAFNVPTQEGGLPSPGGDLPVFERVPQQEGTHLTLHGRDALAMVADYRVGEHELYYTTSQPVGNLPTAGGRLLTLDGYAGDDGETVLHYDSRPEVTTLAGAEPVVTWNADDGTLRLNYTHDAALYQVTADGLAEPLLLRITDRDEMTGMWRVSGARGEGNETVEVFGAHLVRTVTFDGEVAHLTGSMTEAGRLQVHVPAGITEVTWNGAPLGDADTGPGGAVTGDVPGPESVDTPELSTWRVAEENPEATVAFDDSDWVVADDTTAENRRQGPGPDTGVVLDSNHYRYFEGDVWYRAHYTAGASGTVTHNGNGGTGGPGHGHNSASMLVWVNGVYAGAAMAEGADKTFEVPDGAATPGEDVVLSVLVRNQGQNLDWSDNGLSKQNRGLWNARLNNDGPVTWKIQGARDVDEPLDSDRTLYNNGGLYGERAGWYLPGYPDEAWAETTTLHASEPGVAWYRSSFDLDVPAGQDTSFALKVNATDFGDTFAQRTDASRTVMFVNGWNIGTWVGYVGPQSQFTIPSGLLDMNGENEIAIAVTAEEPGAGPDSIDLVQVGNMTGGMPAVQNDAPALPPYDLSAELTPTSEAGTAEVSGALSIPELAGDALTEISLDWGDGGEPETLGAAGFAGSHTYADDGVYTVAVTAVETVGLAELAERTFTVTVENGQIVVDDDGGSDGGQDSGSDGGQDGGSDAGQDGGSDAGDQGDADGTDASDTADDGAGGSHAATDADGSHGATGADDGTDGADDGAAGSAGPGDAGGLPSTGAQLGGLGLMAGLLAAGAFLLQRRRSVAPRG